MGTTASEVTGVILAGLGALLVVLLLTGALGAGTALPGRAGTHIYLTKGLGYVLAALAMVAGIALILTLAWSAILIWILAGLALLGALLLGKVLAIVAAAILGVAVYAALSRR